MENISSKDFDRLENLLKNKNFEELDWHEKQWVLTIINETEYYSMSEIYTTLKKESETQIEVEPLVETKNKLDSSFKRIHKQNVFLSLYHLKIPVYQSIGIALVCFTIGLISTIYKPKPIVIHDTVQVIKYITKPTYANTLKPLSKANKGMSKNHIKKIHTKTVAFENRNDIVVNEETITEKSLQQDIAMQNINRVEKEKNGSSIEGDTILQKMLVTVY
jgi:hypothetical protein